MTTLAGAGLKHDAPTSSVKGHGPPLHGVGAGVLNDKAAQTDIDCGPRESLQERVQNVLGCGQR